MRTGRGKARHRPSRATRSRKARPREKSSPDESALRETEQRFDDLFRAASIWFWEIDPNGIVTYVSHNYEAQLGIPSSALIGRRFDNVPGTIVAPEERRRVLDCVRQRRGWRDFLYSRKLLNGKIMWIKTSAVPIFDKKGELRGWRGTGTDVTAQVETERALRAGQQPIKKNLEAASDWFFELDKDEFITYISPNFQALFGVPSDIVGKRFVDFPGAEFDPAELERIRAARRARQPYRDFVYARIFPSGEKRWLSSSAAPIFDENGEWQGYRGVVTDITERMRAEAFARLAQRRLHDAVSYVRQPFVVYDAQDRVVSFNHAFALLHSAPGEKTAVRQGVSFHELAQWQVLSDFYAGGEAIDSETLLARYQSGGEHTYHLTDDRWMLVGYRRLPDGGAVGLWTDVSALKRAEAERRVLEARLHHSQRLEALGMLAGGIAHDLNNSLVPVLALTKMVAGRLPEGDRSRANLETVVKAAQRSRDLVQQIVAFSRQEEQRRESVDLAAIAADALRLLRASIPSSIRLEEALAPVPTVDGDPGQLHQIIVNLVTNAAQAIGEAHGTIGLRVELDDDGGHARLTVSDTGCGMAEETRARIFEPFFTTRSVGQGTGLGLSVVHGIVASHGGRIDVETAPGKGSRFDVILPLPRSMA